MVIIFSPRLPIHFILAVNAGMRGASIRQSCARAVELVDVPVADSAGPVNACWMCGHMGCQSLSRLVVLSGTNSGYSHARKNSCVTSSEDDVFVTALRWCPYFPSKPSLQLRGPFGHSTEASSPVVRCA